MQVLLPGEGVHTCLDFHGRCPASVTEDMWEALLISETEDGFVYTVSTRGDATIWRFATKTETVEKIGNAAVGTQTYVTSLDVDPTGRFLYYVPGAHGGSERDGTPVVQFDVKTREKKVIAFLEPFYRDDRLGAKLDGILRCHQRHR